MTNLLCEECKPGSFSLGGGIIFDAFNTSTGQLPSGFHIVTESTKHTPELDKKCTGILIILNLKQLHLIILLFIFRVVC